MESTIDLWFKKDKSPVKNKQKKPQLCYTTETQSVWKL